MLLRIDYGQATKLNGVLTIIFFVVHQLTQK